jgi:hypothetical protein
MLISQTAQGKAARPQGSGRVSLAELRRRLADPEETGDGTRQRLIELARRLARVRALGDEYGRVGFSEPAAAAMTVVARA